MASSEEQKINPDIQKERDTRTFDYEELAMLLNGGKEEREKRKKIVSIVESDRDYDGPDPSFMSRMDRFEEWMRKSSLLVRKKEKLGELVQDHKDFMFYNLNVTKKRPNVFFDLHYGMFVPTLMGQATDEQRAKWLIPAINHEILGTYAQTEMGHGTFLRGLETTAHYDPETEEFEIHSPTISSIKWWPGTLGKTCNHAIVMAQLYTRGVCHGIHAFMVQIRNMEDHTSMPGITLGDIGPKFGYNENDNGFLKLDHVRVPRDNMLMKHSQVLEDGTYVAAPRKNLTYGTMTMVRSFIVRDAAYALARACTIAIRYSAVRRQSELRPGEPEPQILSYPTQQHKLFPLLATSYAFFFAQLHMVEMYGSVNEAVGKGDYSNMQELHSVSSGLKAFTTWTTNSGIEVCRMSCGGHGYSLASGLPELYTYFTPNCTYEGENTVLMLQNARYLIKCAREGSNGAKSVAYIHQDAPQMRQYVDLNDLDTICKLYEQRARGLVKFAANKVEEEVRNGEDLVGALNKVSVHSVRAANAHCHYFVVKNFVDEIKTLELSPGLRSVLMDLARLYALDGLSKNSGEFMEEGLLSGKDVKQCHQLVVELLPKIRPNAVSLVDAYEFSDKILMSVLGRYDGNVYPNLLEWAMKSELNKTDVIPAYEKHIRPLLKRHQMSKL
ncbi:peroxisomal acyl-coenzyme A oxidase 1-like [Styela clava]